MPATRAALQALGRPYVIENVADTGHVVLHFPLLLCGTMFGLPVRRHRVFESSLLLLQPGPCRHRPGDMSFDHGGKQPESAYRAAMGVGWMTVLESRQAIPPAYTECIGRQLLAAVPAAGVVA